ncbi:hypothetical protein E8E14_012646 [Neopestalotiopsis sp. 37M]|nr:hypothetical protein E8E14_012646 [Neopestalotiopsis sp. 37M]
MASSQEITLCTPSKYGREIKGESSKKPTTPDADFFYRSWSPIEEGKTFDDLVEYEKGAKLKNVKGIDTVKGPGDFLWRGKGLLKPITSKWEVLGWGLGQPLASGDVERWMVIWFAPTLFTAEGVDILTDRREGLTEKTLSDIRTQLTGMKECTKLVELVEKNLFKVDVELPWKETNA